jgi:hypothetical protein
MQHLLDHPVDGAADIARAVALVHNLGRAHEPGRGGHAGDGIDTLVVLAPGSVAEGGAGRALGDQFRLVVRGVGDRAAIAAVHVAVGVVAPGLAAAAGRRHRMRARAEVAVSADAGLRLEVAEGVIGGGVGLRAIEAGDPQAVDRVVGVALGGVAGGAAVAPARQIAHQVPHQREVLGVAQIQCIGGADSEREPALGLEGARGDVAVAERLLRHAAIGVACADGAVGGIRAPDLADSSVCCR